MIRNLICGGLAICLGCSLMWEAAVAQTFADDSGPTNAALIYWQAFSLLPEMSEAESGRVRDAASGEGDMEAVEDVMSRSQAALKLMAAVPRGLDCHWEIVEDGPYTVLPHLGKARLMARLLAIQARRELEQGKPQAAVEAIGLAMRLARDVDDGTLVALLVGNAIESLIIDVAQPHMDKLDDGSARALQQAVAALPERVHISEAFKAEQEMFGGWIAKLARADAPRIEGQLRELGLQGEVAKGFAALEQPQRIELVAELQGEYVKLIEAAKADPEKAAGKLAALEGAYGSAANPLISNLMPTVSRVYTSHREMEQKVDAFAKALAKRQ